MERKLSFSLIECDYAVVEYSETRLVKCYRCRLNPENVKIRKKDLACTPELKADCAQVFSEQSMNFPLGGRRAFGTGEEAGHTGTDIARD